MSNLYHQNRQVAFDAAYGILYHNNGKIVYDSFNKTVYHSNGNIAYETFHKRANYSNGNLAYDPYDKIARYENGTWMEENSSGIELNLGSGIIFRLADYGNSISLTFNGQEVISVNFKAESETTSPSKSTPKKASNASKCDYCGNQYTGGFFTYLRSETISSGYNKFNFCSTSCYNNTIDGSDFTMVGADGLTESERYNRDLKNTASNNHKKVSSNKTKITDKNYFDRWKRSKKEDEKDQAFLKKYGPVIIFVLACILNYGIVMNQNPKDLLMTLVICNAFLGICLLYFLFPKQFEKFFDQ